MTACLGAGADLGARDESDFTPLHQAAASNERPAVIETLLKAGADLQAQDQWQYTTLHRAAAKNRNPKVLEALIQEGRRRLGAPERAGRNLGPAEAPEAADQPSQ